MASPKEAATPRATRDARPGRSRRCGDRPVAARDAHDIEAPTAPTAPIAQSPRLRGVAPTASAQALAHEQADAQARSETGPADPREPEADRWTVAARHDRPSGPRLKTARGLNVHADGGLLRRRLPRHFMTT